MDRYVVIGNPISHSLSPAIQARFAAQTRDAIEYATLLAELGGFEGAATRFFAAGGMGANVTLPFKIDAFRFATDASERARRAGAANFLARRGDRIEADNTDGAGLIADLEGNLALTLRGARILLVGAGGAARGVIGPLLERAPERLVLANRSAGKARELAQRFAAAGPIEAVGLDAIAVERFDVVLNATSSSTHGEPLALPAGILGAHALAYDMAYGPAARAFLQQAASLGARTSDGLGMLVEQAAESYRLWRGRRPDTAPVLAELRARQA